MTRSGGDHRFEGILADLERRGTKAVHDDRTGDAIPVGTAYGVSVATLRTMAKSIGTDHALALELWKSGRYEARLLATLIDDPSRLTVAQMDSWCRDFDDRATCDHACLHLFGRTPHALGRVAAWARRTPEFQKRAAFALLAGVALHGKAASNDSLVGMLALVEAAAVDERSLVKTAVSWSLRSLGRRPALRKEATTVAKRLAASDNPTARWVGEDALRDLGRDKANRDRADRDRKASSRSALQRSSAAGVIDAYLARLAPEPRAALERLRAQILAAAPGAEECISYGLPAFRLDGPLVAFGATTKHCAFYPMSATIVDALRPELEGFNVSKGTIRFQPGQPLSATLVRRIVRARMRENSGK